MHDFEVVFCIADGADLVVGDDVAVKAPLLAEDLGHAGIVFDVVHDAEAVEAGHDAAGAARDHCVLERLHVDLTHRLLVCPGGDVVTVLLLVIEEVMLDVGVNAPGAGRGEDLCGDAAREHAVLAVILEVTAGERAAVGVHRRRVPAVVAVPHTLFTDQDALLVCEFLVPGRRDHLCGAPVTGTRRTTGGDVTVLRLAADRARAVGVDRLFLTDTIVADRLEEADGDDLLHLFIGELVHEDGPSLGRGLAVDGGVVALDDRLFIIRVIVHHLGQTDRDGCRIIFGLRPVCGESPIFAELGRPQLVRVVIRTEDIAPLELGVDLFLGDLEVVAVLDIIQHRVGRFGVLRQVALVRRRSLGIGADEVRTGHDGHRRADRGVVVDSILVVGVGEHVVHRDAGVRRVLDLQSGQGDRVAQSVLRPVVRVLRSVEDVVARIQLIAGVVVAVRILPVPRRHVVRVPGGLDGLRFARFEQVGLFEVQQADLGLFDAALGVRSLDVEFHDVLTGDVARVGDGDGSRELRVRSERAFHLDGEVAPLEGGVGQAVAERIDDVSVIPVVRAGVRGVAVFPFLAVEVGGLEDCLRLVARQIDVARRDLGIHGLIVLVAEVDALFILDGRTACAVFAAHEHRVLGVVVVVIVLCAVAEVLHHGVDHEVARVDVHRSAGGVDLALEDLQAAAEAVVARLADVNDRIDFGVLFQLAELDDVTGVEEDDDLLKIIGNVIDELFFSVGQLEVMILRSVFQRAVFTRRADVIVDVLDCKVSAFAAETADDDERRVAVAVIGRFDRGGVVVEGKLLVFVCRGRPLRFRAEGAARISLIESFQLRVDVQAFRFERGVDICAFFELTGTGTRAAVAERVGVDTEDTDILHIGIRELVLRAVYAAAILEQDRALAGDLNIFFFGRFLQFFIAGERRIVMAHAVIAIAHLFFLCDLRHRKGRYRRNEHRNAKHDHK